MAAAVTVNSSLTRFVFAVTCLLALGVVVPTFFADGILVKVPENTLACNGHTETSFQCETDDMGLEWKFRSWDPNKHDSQYVYNSYGTVPGYYVQKSKDSKSVELNINSTTIDKAGLYICVDREGVGQSRSAELVVIEKSNISAVQNVTNKTRLEVCYEVEYRGNIRPTAHCWNKNKIDTCKSIQGETNSPHTVKYCTSLTLFKEPAHYECFLSLKNSTGCLSGTSKNVGGCKITEDFKDVSLEHPKGFIAQKASGSMMMSESSIFISTLLISLLASVLSE